MRTIAAWNLVYLMILLSQGLCVHPDTPALHPAVGERYSDTIRRKMQFIIFSIW